MIRRDLPQGVVARRAIVYVRQSTGVQVTSNLESQRRQYELADLARDYGFRDVAVIDDDLGVSASGTVDRPGFRDLVGQICQGVVGAVFCLEASRLARNGRDWHHLLELCALVEARVIDADGIYDPSSPNDRLLLGLKGTMSEFELTTLRRRLLEAAQAKARRGELRMPVPIGYVWPRDTGLSMDPDRRVQDAIRTIFRLFDRHGSAHQVLMRMRKEGLVFPRPADAKLLTALVWRSPCYRNIISVLQNPFYAGAYAYGKSRVQTMIVDGAVRKAYGRACSRDQWTLLREHHEGYISWEQYEKNQDRLARNSFRKPAGAAKAARGGQALLGGLLRCRRCGRMLHVLYGGRGIPKPRYNCRRGHAMQGLDPCISFGAHRPDAAIGREILLAAQPLAVEAAIVAERDAVEQGDERRRALELERQQAEYEVRIAARRYHAVDPDNRLVAAELEARWNEAMNKLRECEAKTAAQQQIASPPPDRAELFRLATDLASAWNAPSTESRTKQRLVRALIEEIIVDVDDGTREVVLLVHWRGGQHSELRVRKPATGEHTKQASVEADTVIRDMATKWSDEHIAATLNRMGVTTGQGLSWTAKRVCSHRRNHGIHGYESAIKDGRCLTMVEAAAYAGVSCHAIRRLIQSGILPARQVVFDAPWQILAADLERPRGTESSAPTQTSSRSPVSQFWRRSNPQDSRHLKKRCTMKPASPGLGWLARCRCCRAGRARCPQSA
jgi:DNA invertase Pin-like site-specific DNA recombinase